MDNNSFDRMADILPIVNPLYCSGIPALMPEAVSKVVTNS